MLNDIEDLAFGQTRRRSVIKGAAWSVPAVTIAAAAPAMASSGPLAVAGNGSITRKSCTATSTSSGAVTVEMDSRPAYSSTTQPTSGYWVTNLPAGVTVASATQTIYVDSRFTNVAWSYAGTATSQRQWSLPTRDASAPTYSGLTAYTTTYTGNAWTRNDTADPSYAVATYGVYFNLSATTPANSCGGLFSFRNYRRVVLSNGTSADNLKAIATA